MYVRHLGQYLFKDAVIFIPISPTHRSRNTRSEVFITVRACALILYYGFINPRCATTVAMTRTAAKMTTTTGPTFRPGVSSSKNLISPAPPLGIGPSLLPPFFFTVFGNLTPPLFRWLPFMELLILLTLI